MKRILLLLIVLSNATLLFSQAMFNITQGTTVKSMNGVHIVLNNMSFLNNGVTQQSQNDGTIKFTGSTNDSISGSSTTIIDRLNLSKDPSALLVLKTGIKVNSEFIFTSGLFDLNNYSLDLGSNGVLTNESNISRSITTGTGYIQATRLLNSPSAINAGNLGIVISSSANLGSTIIRRGHNVQQNVYGYNHSIQRYFDILPENNSNSNATLRLNYFDSELNGINKSDLSLWKSTDNINWTSIGYNNRDNTNNYIEKNGVNDFSKWTLSAATPPVITCPANITVNNNQGFCNALVDLTVANGTIATGIPLPAILYKIGSNAVTFPYSFPVGVTTVTAIASNGIENDASCSFTVTVVDNELPVITNCPAITTQCFVPTNFYIIPELTAYDNCGIQSINFVVTGATSRSGNGGNASGTFNPGVNTINWTILDLSGHITTCSSLVQIDKVAVDAGTYGPYTTSSATVALSGTPAGGAFSGAGVSGNTFNPALAGPGIHTINYSYISSAGCSNTAATSIVVSVPCNFTVDNIVGPGNACAYITTTGINATYSIAATSATSYNWTLPAGATLASGINTTSSILVHYTSTFVSGTISVTVSSLCGNPITRTLLIIKSIPAVPAAITGALNACPYIGTNTAVTYSIPPVAGAITYRWTLPPTVTLLSATPDSTSIAISFNTGFDVGANKSIRVKSISGCGSSADGILTISVTKPAVPGVITGATNACLYIGIANTATYKTGLVANATSYTWTVPTGATIISHPNGVGANDTVVTVAFDNSFVSPSNISVQSVSGCGISTARTFAVSRTIPGTPGVITGPADACPLMGTATTATYAIVKVANAMFYNWSVPAGVTVNHPNGAGINDTSIVVIYDNSFISSAITVNAGNGCGNSAYRSLTIAKNVPATPGVITGASNPCPFIGISDVTYTIRKVANTTSYTWSIPVGATISGHPGGAGINDTIITVTFTNAITTGNISVFANNNCASSTARTLAIVRLLPATPGVITGATNPCPFIGISDVTYKISKVANATSYTWSVPVGATISGHPGGIGINDTIITVTFTNAITTGNISVIANNNCASSAVRTLAIVRLLPSTPGVIAGPTDPCPFVGVSAATYSILKVANASFYTWSVPAGASISSHPRGSGINDTIITVTFTNAITTGNISVTANNNCASSLPRNLAIVRKLPAVPGAITTTVISAACPNRQYGYSIASLPLNATSLAWTVPAGGTIISQGALNVVIQYGSGAVTDTLRVVGVNNCTSSGERKLVVTLPVCASILAKGISVAPPAPTNTFSAKEIQLKIFPNPSSTHFNIELISSISEKAMMRIIDISGRQLSNQVIVPNQVTLFGNKLKTGVYFVEVIQGTNRKVVKLVKLN